MAKKTSYNLTIPTEIYRSLKKVAAQDGTTVAELLRRATKLYLFVRSISQEPGARLLVEHNGEPQEIVLDLI